MVSFNKFFNASGIGVGREVATIILWGKLYSPFSHSDSLFFMSFHLMERFAPTIGCIESNEFSDTQLFDLAPNSYVFEHQCRIAYSFERSFSG